MSKLVRFGVSIADDILNQFDKIIKEKDYPTRSKAIESLVRQFITNREFSNANTSVTGSINVIYDHHKRELVNELTNVQHDFQDVIVSSQHIHLDHDKCYEIIELKGQKMKVEKLANLVKGTKGVKQSSLCLVTAGKEAD